MAVAFLPVFYSKHALNDVVTLAPVTLALVGCLLVVRARPLGRLGARRRRDRRGDRDEVHGRGDAADAAVAAGLRVHARPRGAAARAARRPRRSRASPASSLFAILNPYAILNLDEARGQINGQSGQADTRASSARTTCTAGCTTSARSAGGSAGCRSPPRSAARSSTLRRDWRRGAAARRLPGLPLPLHGRAGRASSAAGCCPPTRRCACSRATAAVALADARCAARRALARSRGLAALLCAQGLLASVHVDRVLGREDTRAQALRWLARERARRARASSSSRSSRRRGGPRCERPMWPVERPFQAYEKRLRVRDIDALPRARATAGSWSASTQKERGLKAGLRSSRNYYRGARRRERGDRARSRRSRAGADAGRVLLRQLVQLPPARLRAARARWSRSTACATARRRLGVIRRRMSVTDPEPPRAGARSAIPPRTRPAGPPPDLRAARRSACSCVLVGVRRLADLSQLRHLLHARLGQGARATATCPTTTSSARRRRTRSRRSSAWAMAPFGTASDRILVLASLFGLLGFYVVTFVFTRAAARPRDRAARASP